MNNGFKRILVLASVGGMAFSAIGWGCQPFAQSQPYITFLRDVGNYAVDVAVDQALANVDPAINAWINDPLTDVYQNIWSGWVNYTFPQDPTYDTLLRS